MAIDWNKIDSRLNGQGEGTQSNNIDWSAVESTLGLDQSTTQNTTIDWNKVQSNLGTMEVSEPTTVFNTKQPYYIPPEQQKSYPKPPELPKQSFTGKVITFLDNVKTTLLGGFTNKEKDMMGNLEITPKGTSSNGVIPSYVNPATLDQSKQPKLENVKEQANTPEWNKWQAQKQQEARALQQKIDAAKINPEEYFIKAATFGYAGDTNKSQAVTPSQKGLELLGTIVAYSSLMHYLSPAIGGVVSKVPGGAKALEATKNAVAKYPWKVGYPLSVAKAGATGVLGGTIEKAESVDERVQNAINGGLTFAAFDAIAYPVVSFFRPTFYSIGKVERTKISEQAKTILPKGTNAEQIFTEPKTIYFRNPNDPSLVLKVTQSTVKGKANVNIIPSSSAGVDSKSLPLITKTEAELFKTDPSIYNKLVNFVSGKSITAEAPIKGNVIPPRVEATGIAKETPIGKLISYEGAPDIKTVGQYKSDILAGVKIPPIKIVNEGNGKFGIEDGKHRYQAYKELGYDKVPTVDVTNEVKTRSEEAQKVSEEVKPTVTENVKIEVPNINVNPEDNVPIIGEREVKIVNRISPTKIFTGLPVKVTNSPTTYTDGYMLLTGINKDKVSKWVQELIKRKGKAREITKETVDEIIPKENGTKLPDSPIAYKNVNGINNAYFDAGLDLPVAINAEAYRWLKNKGYSLYVTGKNNPIRLEKGGKTAGVLMPIVNDLRLSDIKKEISKKQASQNINKKVQLNSANKGDVLGFNPSNLDDPESLEAVKESDKIIKRSDIAKQLSEKLNVPIRRGKFNLKALGIFKQGPEVIRIKSGGLSTIFHEVGHFLDQHFNISNRIGVQERKSLMTEYGYKYEGQAKKQRQEAFAEFLRFMMTGQESKAKQLAPKFYDEYAALIETLPEVKTVLDTATSDYRRWREMPATAKVLSNISIGKEKGPHFFEKISNSLDVLYTSLIDDLYPISKFSKLAGKIPVQENPYILARNMRGWVGKASTFLEKGTFGKNFWEVKDGKMTPKFTGKSFRDIVKPISDKGNLNDFRVYLVSQRVLELKSRGIKTGISDKDAMESLQEISKKHPEFNVASKELYKYQDSLLRYAFENGLLGREGYTKIKELNKYRVPFYRVMEESDRLGSTNKRKVAGNLSSSIKKIKGSERDIVDPLEGIIKDTYAIISASERNNIGMAMARLARQSPEMGRMFEEVDKAKTPVNVNVKEVLEKAMGIIGKDAEGIIPPELSEIVATIFRPMQQSGPNMININFGDKTRVFQLEKELFKSLQGLNDEDIALIMRILAMPAKVLRAGATLTPDFAVRNPIRDQFSAMVFSKYGFKPGINLVSGIGETFKRGDVYDLWRMAGGEHSMFVSLDRENLQKNLKEIASGKKDKALHILRHPLDTLRIMSEIGEQATRLGEMKLGLSKMDNPIAAAFASREVTLDFARIGAKTKAMNQITAFWNANVQGTDKVVRAFKDKPFQTLVRILLGITLPSVLLYFANRNDKRYREIPQWQRDLFWIVLTPNHIYRIPKPFELGIMFGSVPERILESIDNSDPEVFDQLMKSIMDGGSPGFIPTGLIPIIENITNYSFFLDRPIVSEGKQGLPPEYQSNTYTSETAKIIGETLGYSPAKIDNLIQGYSGGLGRYATQSIDAVLKGTGLRSVPTAPAKDLADYPVIKAFVVRNPVGSSSESVNRIYNLYSKANSDMQYVNKLVKEGRLEEAQNFVKGNMEVVFAQMLNTVVDDFSKINKAKDEIRNSGVLSAQAKKDKLLQLDTAETTLAQKTLEYIKNAQ